MVDIVQSSASQLLIRKIGYSVGLESTLSRFEQLVDFYSTHRQLTEVGWRDLVRNVYRRDMQAGKHFANLFRALDFVETDNGRPVPLSLLDAGSLLRELFSSDIDRYRAALSGLLLYAITLADGELFAALLATRFQRGAEIPALEAFRALKLGLMYSRYMAPGQRRKLHQIIDFRELDNKTDRKTMDTRPAGPFASDNVLARQDTNDFSVSLSADWYKKVPPRRASWARDLNLFNEDDISSAGQRYLDGLRGLLPIDARSGDALTVVIMPTDLEFRSHHVTWPLEETYVVDHIDLASVIAATYANASSTSAVTSEDQELEFLRWCLEKYSRADIRFHMLRRDLPYTVFLAVGLGRAVAERRPLPSPRERIEVLARSCPQLLLRSSRNSLYGISFSKR